jgi:hypothetical protein
LYKNEKEKREECETQIIELKGQLFKSNQISKVDIGTEPISSFPFHKRKSKKSLEKQNLKKNNQCEDPIISLNSPTSLNFNSTYNQIVQSPSLPPPSPFIQQPVQFDKDFKKHVYYAIGCQTKDKEITNIKSQESFDALKVKVITQPLSHQILDVFPFVALSYCMFCEVGIKIGTLNIFYQENFEKDLAGTPISMGSWTSSFIFIRSIDFLF